jgi:adenine-specific DNA methylase
VQYAELMDFCFAWLRLGLKDDVPAFERETTRTQAELTGNDTMGRGLEHFTEGLSVVFQHYSAALKPGAPFVFTYHHNAPTAYVPLVVAILDAGLDCTASLPAPAEMGASLHIARTGSSVLDSIFVCRAAPDSKACSGRELTDQLRIDVTALSAGGVKVTEGDMRCLLAGHLARLAVNRLRSAWDSALPLNERMARAHATVLELSSCIEAPTLLAQIRETLPHHDRTKLQYEAAL